MQREELIGVVKSIVNQETQIPIDSIGPGTRLSDLDIDSLDILKLGLAFEKSFNITITTVELMQIETFDDIITGLAGKLNSR